MLEGKPKFGEIVTDFLGFIGEAKLVIHNAAFDIKFLNAELEAVGFDPLPISRAVDTLLIAQQRFPGAQASLDALCRRFNIDLTARDKHGALIDCHLLAQVYLELTGGRQPGLELAADAGEDELVVPAEERPRREPRPHLTTGLLTAEERARHDAFVGALTDPLWRR
jgi:DNA polymerase-3 subunit epsilon